MSPPRRRSTRLRGSHGMPSKPRSFSPRPLSSLTECDETPTHGTQPTLDAIVSSPMLSRTPATDGHIKPNFEEMHPAKAHLSTASPAFDFRFARPTPELGPEAQKIMDELRGEAHRIKAKLIAEREGNDCKSSLADLQDRKIATPKGKVGRFSGVHMAEFKKMDSIAGHPSAFRAQPGWFTPVTKSLKRSQSTAKLDDRDNCSGSQDKRIAPHIEHSVNTTLAKRARVTSNQDEQHLLTPKLAATPLSRSQSVLSSIVTPTQASLARSASVKRTTHIPTLSYSPSKRNLITPRRLTKPATTSKIATLTRPDTSQTVSSIPSKLHRVKSILRPPVAGLETSKSANPTTVPLSIDPKKADLNKELPSVPTTPAPQSIKIVKHVNFTPTTVSKNMATIESSPSPFKSGISKSKSSVNLGSVCYPSLPGVVESLAEVNYPSLTGSRPLPELPQQKRAWSPPSVPGTFTFRNDNTINFGAPPRGFGSSPGQASIRQVKPSIIPGSMPGSFPDANKENKGDLPSVPHEMSNKKRHRASSDDDSEKDQLKDSPTKKRKRSTPEIAKLVAPKIGAKKEAPKAKAPSLAKKGTLSLSRLNILSRPKMRK